MFTFIGIKHYTNDTVKLILFDEKEKTVILKTEEFKNFSYTPDSNGKRIKVYCWEENVTKMLSRNEDRFVVNNKLNYLCANKLRFGDVVTVENNRLIKGNGRVKKILINLFLKSETNGKFYVMPIEYDWKNYKELMPYYTSTIKNVLNNCHLPITWNSKWANGSYSLRKMLINFAAFADVSEVDSKSRNSLYFMDHGNGDFFGRFNMIKHYMKEYMKILFVINEMTYYQIRDLFDRYSRTAAFDYLKYSKLIEMGGALMRWRVDPKTTKMEYNKYYFKTKKGIIVINENKIHSYDFDSFFGSIYMEMCKKQRADISFAQMLHMETLHNALFIKRNSTGAKRKAMKYLCNAGGFGGINNSYGIFPPSKTITETIVSRSYGIMDRLIKLCKEKIKGFTLLQANTDSIIFIIDSMDDAMVDEGEEDEEEGEDDDDDDKDEETIKNIKAKVEGEGIGGFIKLRNEGNEWKYAYFNSGQEYVLQRGTVFVKDGDVAKGLLFKSTTIPLTIRKFNFAVLTYLFENDGEISAVTFSRMYKHHMLNSKIGYGEFYFTKGPKRACSFMIFVVGKSDPVYLNKAIINNWKINVEKIYNFYFSKVVGWWKHMFSD